MGYISEVNLNGQTHKISSSLYGTCGTTANTAEKVVTLSDYSELAVGTTIRVKFSYGNSTNNPTLNVNNLGAVAIYRYGTTAPGASPELSWNAGAVISFTYDGTAWMMNDWINMSPVMTGATANDDGTSGLAPAPVAGDNAKYLRGDASYAIPGVMTVNGRTPDPITGDITVIEGGGSGSYGSYRLDATIPVSAWSGSSSPYTTTVTNSLIKSTMDGTETWLDDPTAMLGETTFTTQDGSLLISTTVKPTAQWVLHVALALNGADVLADMTNSVSKIIPLVTGSTNNTGSTIASGDYFEADGNLYKATAAIPDGSAWSGSATAQPGTALNNAVSSLNSNMSNLFKVKTVSFANSAISANTSFSVSKAVNADAGYSPLCVAGIALSRVNGIYFDGFYVSGSDVIVWGFNGTAVTVFNGDVYVLCKKTSL